VRRITVCKADYHRRIVSVPLFRQAPQRALRQTPRPPLPPAPYLVVGLGKAGFAAARALAERAGAATVRVWDSAVDTAQMERAAELRRLGVEVRLGGDGLDLLGDAQTVVKSPGVPPEIPVVAEARRRELGLVDELEIGWHLVPAPTVAVTGTNGKSTTAALLLQVLGAQGLTPALAGNTEFGPPLSELAMTGRPGSVVAEVSSYQAESASALAPDGAVFTNLTPEHLNRYRDMKEYGEAKRRLFVREGWCVPVAAVNVDDELGRSIAADVSRQGGLAITYGAARGADYRIAECRWGLRESGVSVEVPDGKLRLQTRLPGRHNAANLTAALALADGLGLPREPTLEALAGAAPVPGRFEVLDVELPFDVVVDFAIAPASVASVLATARSLVAERGGRLLTVFAIIGRAAPLIGRQVGAVARRSCDHLVLCGSSYRGEPRLVGLAELAAGARSVAGGGLEIVIDRRKAIARAFSLARPGDLVAILGRGVTTREATDGRGGYIDLDDREIVRELAQCAS
jgi:UDP-N-acetylmuramoylalanine-D-glutamate ligase